MGTINVVKNGDVPATVSKVVDFWNGKNSKRCDLNALDSDIEFLVCDIEECHGSFNEVLREATLWPISGDVHKWFVEIKF